MTKYIAYVTALTLPLMLTTITASAAQQDTNAVSATGKATPHFKGDNLSKDAKISLKEARTIALKTSPGKIVDEELEVEDGGSGLRYSFVIQHGSANREVGVDAKTGKVLEDSKEEPSSAAAPSGADSNQKLRAAAEPFENLTEISFAAAWTKIDQTAGKAETAAEGARGSLSKDAAVELDARIAAMKSALQKHDRAGVALSSIEGYRVLVSAVTDNAKIPTEVSLLDYAGFRYDANLKAQPIRWDEMAATVSFARKTWDTVLPKAKASPVATTFEKAITDMNTAVMQKNKSLAASSVKNELDLVDQLEKFFSAH